MSSVYDRKQLHSSKGCDRIWRDLRNTLVVVSVCLMVTINDLRLFFFILRLILLGKLNLNLNTRRCIRVEAFWSIYFDTVTRTALRPNFSGSYGDCIAWETSVSRKSWWIVSKNNYYSLVFCEELGWIYFQRLTNSCCWLGSFFTTAVILSVNRWIVSRVVFLILALMKTVWGKLKSI